MVDMSTSMRGTLDHMGALLKEVNALDHTEPAPKEVNDLKEVNSLKEVNGAGEQCGGTSRRGRPESGEHRTKSALLTPAVPHAIAALQPLLSHGRML
jgi:hypothetical protein